MLRVFRVCRVLGFLGFAGFFGELLLSSWLLHDNQEIECPDPNDGTGGKGGGGSRQNYSLLTLLKKNPKPQTLNPKP